MPGTFDDMPFQSPFFGKRRATVGASIGGRVQPVFDPVQGNQGTVVQHLLLDLALGNIGFRAKNAHGIVLPPLTLITCPVTNDASCDAR